MQQAIYRRFIGNIKILQIRANYNGENGQEQEYKEVVGKLEMIKNRRHLAMVGEENEEKRLYSEIIEMLEEKYQDNDDKSVLEIYEGIKGKIESYKREREEEKEAKYSEREK